MKISILVPTRKRKNNIDRFIDGFLSLLSQNIIELVIGIDVDDDSYDIENIKSKSKNIIVVRTPKTDYLSNLYNIMVWYSSGNIIGYFADDVYFVDTSIFYDIIKRFEEKEITLYSFNPDVSTHGFVSKKSVEILGFLFPSCMEHGYMDYQLTTLYKNIDRYYYDERNLFLHFHWHMEPSLFDETYFKKTVEKDINGKTCDDRDLIKFEKYKELYLEIHTSLLKENCF